MPRKKKRPSLIQQLDDSELFNETDFLKDARIDVDDFNEEVVRHSELHYHYGKLFSFARKIHAVAELKVDLAKREVQTALATSHERIRKERTEAGEKCTEALLENESRMSEEYQTALKHYAECKETAIEAAFESDLLAIGEKTFSKRPDLLKTMGHLLGKEFDSGVPVYRARAREAADEYTSQLKAKVDAAKEVIRQHKEKK